MSTQRTIEFAGHKEYTLYSSTEIGKVLQVSETKQLQGVISFSADAEIRPVIEQGLVTVVQVTSGPLIDFWLSVDEHELRYAFPEAPARPQPQLNF